MSGVLLDIGAGGTDFVRLFKRFNPDYNLMYLCGEPDWDGRWDGLSKAGKIRKICASYNQFNVPDSSLHFVTLNAYHPFMPPVGIEDELIRTLVPLEGLFVSAHPVGRHPELSDEYFYKIGFVGNDEGDTVATPRWVHGFTGTKGFWRTPVSTMEINDLPPFHYPASRVILSRFRELQLPEEWRNRSSRYCYSNSNARPDVRVWLRNEKPAI